MTTSIHISDIRTFRQCRRKWAWSSPTRMNLEPVIPYVPFFTGRAVHAALEFYYRDHIPMTETVDKYLSSEDVNMQQIGELWPTEKVAFDEAVQLIRDILNHYAMWQEQDDKVYSDQNLEFIALETEFDIPMPAMAGFPSRALRLAGRMDGLVRHIPTNEYWIWETKTTRSIAELVRSLANDEQCGAYIYAAQKTLKVPVVGVLYNIIRKKAPSRPAIVSGGQLSRNKSVDTTAFAYKAELRSIYPDWSDETMTQMGYGEMLNNLLDNEAKFFLRFPIYRSEYQIHLLMQGLYQTAREMIRPQTPMYPSPSWLNCNFCSFKSPCLVMNDGGDYELILREEFQKRQAALSMREQAEKEDD